MASREERKQKITAERQRQILDAALGVFSKKGFAQATIAEIAQSAGVAEGTIYNYYRSKYDLLVSLISDSMETERLTGVLEQGASAGDTALICPLIQDRLNIGFDNADRFLVLMSEIYHDASLRELYSEQVAQPILKGLENYLESSVSQGAFRRLDTRVAARALMGMVMGMAIIYMFEGETSVLRKIPRDEIASELAGVMLEGVRKR